MYNILFNKNLHSFSIKAYLLNDPSELFKRKINFLLSTYVFKKDVILLFFLASIGFPVM